MTIPAGAKLLLDFIGNIEAPKGYDTIYGNKQHLLAKPITTMTLDEIIAAQPTWSKRYGSSAAGRYQFMRATLRGLMADLKLPGSLIFDPYTQDVFGYELLKRRGYERFVAGQLSGAAFALNLAKEWASLPVLVKVVGANRVVEAGESYYAGDKLNKSLVRPANLTTAIEAARTTDWGMKWTPQIDAPGHDIDPLPTLPPAPPAEPETTPEKQPDPSSNLGWVGAAVLVAVFIIGAAIVALNLVPR